MVPSASIGQRQRGRRRHLGAGLAIALAALTHLVVLTTVAAAGLASGWGGLGAAAPAKAIAGKPERPWQATCDGDALLAAAPRALMCASPFTSDVGACLRDLRTAVRSELLGCHIANLPSVAFALTPITPEHLRQLDPEPLLESLTEDKQRQFEQQQALAAAALVVEAVKERVRPPNPQEQVVEVVKPDVEIAPDNARLVSDYNTKVDQQTVARGSDREAIAKRAQDEALAAKPDPREASTAKPSDGRPPSPHPDAPPLPGVLSMRNPGAQASSDLASDAQRQGNPTGTDQVAADGLRSRRGDGYLDRREVRPDSTRGDGGGGGGGAPIADLRPSREVLERAVGGGSVDHLTDVAEGDETALSSRQWIHASFFNRLKRRVHQTWNPVEIWRRRDPSGAVYGLRTRVTVVRVSLKPGGELAKVIVVRPSGVDVLDDEAVRAFHEAAPFPHPPGALVDDDGLITFDFGFHLEIGGGHTDWKLLR